VDRDQSPFFNKEEKKPCLKYFLIVISNLNGLFFIYSV
jgi:hypothetical protein